MKSYALQRALDLALAIPGLLLALPILGLLVLAISLDSEGNPFFLQTRVGRRGVPFTIIKLRTLHLRHFGIEPGEEPAPYRITRLGHWLRPSRLDELPQLWNVIRGEMAMVGPRPVIPEKLAGYSDIVGRRNSVRPGITGLAQITGNTRLSWPERIALDLVYIERRSLLLDLKIILLTPWALLTGRLACG